MQEEIDRTSLIIFYERRNKSTTDKDSVIVWENKIEKNLYIHGNRKSSQKLFNLHCIN